MNIDVREIDTSNSTVEDYLQWLDALKTPCNDYMNLYRDFIENKPISRIMSKFKTPDWEDGSDFHELFITLPDFLIHHNIKREIMSSIKYKPLEFTGKVFEGKTAHQWDNDKPKSKYVDFAPCNHFIIDSLNAVNMEAQLCKN